MRHWRSSSKNGLKRSSAQLLACGFLALLLVSPPLAAQSVTVRTAPSSNGVALELTLEGYNGTEIIESVSERMRAQVVYLVRLYRSGGVLFGIFGDRLVGEYRLVHEARWDAFEREYCLETQIYDDSAAVTREQTRCFDRQEQFLAQLFHARNLELRLPESGEKLYALVQTRITPIRLVPELRLISLFMSSDEIETAWERVPIGQGREGRQ